MAAQIANEIKQLVYIGQSARCLTECAGGAQCTAQKSHSVDGVAAIFHNIFCFLHLWAKKVFAVRLFVRIKIDTKMQQCERDSHHHLHEMRTMSMSVAYQPTGRFVAGNNLIGY